MSSITGGISPIRRSVDTDELFRPVDAPSSKKAAGKAVSNAQLPDAGETEEAKSEAKSEAEVESEVESEPEAEPPPAPPRGDGTRAFFKKFTQRYSYAAQMERSAKVRPQKYIKVPDSIPMPNEASPRVEKTIDAANRILKSGIAQSLIVGLEMVINAPAGFRHQYRMQGKSNEEAFFMTVAATFGAAVTVPYGQVKKAKVAVASGARPEITYSPFVLIGQTLGKREAKANLEARNALVQNAAQEETEEGVPPGEEDTANINTAETEEDMPYGEQEPLNINAFRRSLRPEQLAVYERLEQRFSMIDQLDAAQGEDLMRDISDLVDGFEPDQTSRMADVVDGLIDTSKPLPAIPEGQRMLTDVNAALAGTSAPLPADLGDDNWSADVSAALARAVKPLPPTPPDVSKGG